MLLYQSYFLSKISHSFQSQEQTQVSATRQKCTPGLFCFLSKLLQKQCLMQQKLLEAHNTTCNHAAA